MLLSYRPAPEINEEIQAVQTHLPVDADEGNDTFNPLMQLKMCPHAGRIVPNKAFTRFDSKPIWYVVKQSQYTTLTISSSLVVVLAITLPSLFADS
jgi:hypothetical protein